MAQVLARLSALQVERTKKPGMYHDGGGLYLQVTETGARSWIYRFTLNGRARSQGLGSFNTYTLAEAREKARQSRQLKADGIDPIEHKRVQRAGKKSAAARLVTFREEAESLIKSHKPGWKNAKHIQQWRNTLETYAYPVIGDVSVADVDTAMITTILEPIWHTKAETASRLRGRLERILNRASSRGLRSGENPARWRGHLDNILLSRSRLARIEHHPAMHYHNVGSFVAKLRKRTEAAALALELVILTATRTVEAIGADWSEVDFKAKIWTIPPERMKMKKEHRVPLSSRAIAVLQRLKKSSESDWIFPGMSGDKPISNNTMLALLDRMKHGDVTVHGFRSTFKDWVSECTNYPREVSEMALAHAIEDKTEAAYRRGDLFQKRRLLMEAWADFLDKPSSDSVRIIPMRRQRA